MNKITYVIEGQGKGVVNNVQQSKLRKISEAGNVDVIPRFIEVKMNDIGAVEEDGEDLIETKFKIYLENLGLVKGERDDMYYVLERDVEEGGSSVPDQYTTNEINTGSTWIDGNPIYRKVFTVDFLELIENGYDFTGGVDAIPNGIKHNIGIQYYLRCDVLCLSEENQIYPKTPSVYPLGKKSDVSLGKDWIRAETWDTPTSLSTDLNIIIEYTKYNTIS